MKVAFKELPCHRSLALPDAFVAQAVGDLPVMAALEPGGDSGSAQAEVDFYIEGENVFARGTLQGWIRVPCSRCIEPMRLPVDETMMVSFLRGGPLGDEDDEDEIDVEELAREDEDVYSYDGEVIDLEPLFRERLVLAIPYAPLCSEDCKGLCAQCGKNLNEGECGCDRQVVDPRLAALKNLKV